MRMQNAIMKPIDEEIIAQLYAWFLEQMIQGKPVTDTLFAEKSIEISKALGSPTVTVAKDWLYAFKQRYSINYKNNDGAESGSYAAVYVKEECVNDEVLTDPLVNEDDPVSFPNAGLNAPVNPLENAVAIKVEIDAPETTDTTAGVPALLNSMPCVPASTNAIARAPVTTNPMAGVPVILNSMSCSPASTNAIAHASATTNPMGGVPVILNSMSCAPTPVNAMTRAPAPINAMTRAPASINAMTCAPAPMNAMMGTPAGINAVAGASSMINVNAPPYLNMYMDPSMYIDPQTYVNTFMNAPAYVNTSTFAGSVTFTEAVAASTNTGPHVGANTMNPNVQTGYAGVPAVNTAMNVVAPTYMDTTGINTTMNTSGTPYINTSPYMNAGPTANAATYANTTASIVTATPLETAVGTTLHGLQNMETESEEQLFPKDFVKRLEKEKISYKNVYYAKDTGLAWKAFPKMLLERMKGKNRASLFEKERVTVLLCMNAAGSHKLAPLFIHKLEKPKALKHCKDELPVIFMSQSQAQMDHCVFTQWYEKHFKPTVKIFQFPEKDGKILLLLDNYQKDSLQLARELEQNDKFEIVLLPPGAASLAQPIEQKVVENTKKFYRLKMLRRVLNFPGGARKFYYDFDLKDCIDLFSEAWAEVTMSGIQNAWSGIVKQTPETCLIKEEIEEDPLEPNLQDIIGLITGEEEPEETVNEFLLRCEDTERHFLTDQMEDDEEEEEDSEEDEDEDVDESGNDDEVLCTENVKKAFETLVTWAKQHPQYIQLQVEYLKSYFENTIKDKRVGGRH